MAKVVWTDEARRWLQEIYNYIAEDDEDSAYRPVCGIHERENPLEFSRSGDTLAYRAAKVLRAVPASFPQRAFGESTRQPVRIVAHMAGLMAWGVSIAKGGYEVKAGGSEDWNTEGYARAN